MVKCLFVGASAREGRGRLVLMQGWDSNTDGCIFLQKTHTLPPVYITKYTGKSKILSSGDLQSNSALLGASGTGWVWLRPEYIRHGDYTSSLGIARSS